MKKFGVFILLLIFTTGINSLDNTDDKEKINRFNFIIPDYIVDITIEGGIGVYLWVFRGHLLE